MSAEILRALLALGCVIGYGALILGWGDLIARSLR